MFVLFLVKGQANSNTSDHQFKAEKHSFTKKACPSNSFSDENDSDSTRTRRKIRPKGVEVIVPEILKVSFIQKRNYSELFRTWDDESPSSFLHCVNRKRGPPQV